MTLGTDHYGREFFDWPVDKGRDLSWLKNYDQWASIFSVGCRYDFFGAYHVEPDRGVVQVANHDELPGKKAWTWGNWEYGLVSQQNLTDEDGPYIEVQSGPLPTQSDYGVLAPHAQVAWREWWYPVHGLGDGFEYATKDAVFQSYRKDGELELRVAATGQFPAAVLTVSRDGKSLLTQKLDLTPKATQRVTIPGGAAAPVDVTLRTREGAPARAIHQPAADPQDPAPQPADLHRQAGRQALDRREVSQGPDGRSRHRSPRGSAVLRNGAGRRSGPLAGAAGAGPARFRRGAV